jgi:hypothetical protein
LPKESLINNILGTRKRRKGLEFILEKQKRQTRIDHRPVFSRDLSRRFSANELRSKFIGTTESEKETENSRLVRAKENAHRPSDIVSAARECVSSEYEKPDWVSRARLYIGKSRINESAQKSLVKSRAVSGCMKSLSR